MKRILFMIILFLVQISFAAEHVPVREIAGEEFWKGEIVINGIVAVRKSGKLVIDPGTKIMFKAQDLDGDEIGDGELYVEGEILSMGTKENPVIFTVEKDAVVMPSRWKYVMVNHAKNAFFQHTIFEGAFSGLQVHFTRAVIRNCLFRKNVDGFRFSTADIDVCGSVMTENKHGIRYEERDSKGRIYGNTIISNEIGIFPVTKCAGKVIFQHNNIYKNRYNIKMGDEQYHDLDFSNNFFGTTVKKDIKAGMYDKNIDKNLPKVIIEPYIKKEIKSGVVQCGAK